MLFEVPSRQVVLCRRVSLPGCAIKVAFGARGLLLARRKPGPRGKTRQNMIRFGRAVEP